MRRPRQEQHRGKHAWSTPVMTLCRVRYIINHTIAAEYVPIVLD